jgi:hypothetical protein
MESITQFKKEKNIKTTRIKKKTTNKEKTHTPE